MTKKYSEEFKKQMVTGIFEKVPALQNFQKNIWLQNPPL